jgi:hypothetical protein
MPNKPTEALEACDTIVKAAQWLEQSANMQQWDYQSPPEPASEFDQTLCVWVGDLMAAANTIRAALDKPMTLPDLPDGWVYDDIYNNGDRWYAHVHPCDLEGEVAGSGNTPREAALNAIAEIKEAQ